MTVTSDPKLFTSGLLPTYAVTSPAVSSRLVSNTVKALSH